MRRRSKLLEATAALMVITLAISFASAGSLKPKTVQEIDGLDHILSIRALQLGTVLWADDLTNESAWTLLNSANASGTKSVEGSLRLLAKFAAGTNDKAIQVYRDVNLSLDENPSISLQMDVSEGISYGVRFYGLFPNGTSFNAWNEASSLQHRTGIGVPENISANLPYETFLATGIPPPINSRIVRVLFYIEAGPSKSGEFSMTVSRITAYTFRLSASGSNDRTITGNFLEIMIELSHLPAGSSFYQAYMGFDIGGAADLHYVGYLTQGYSVLAQSFNYRTKITTSYEFMLLSPQQQLLSETPPLYLDSISFSIILAAQKGAITYFHLDSLALRYAAFPATSISASDLGSLQYMFLLYVDLLFAVPVGAVIVLYEIRKFDE